LKERLENAVVVLASVDGSVVRLVAGVSGHLTDRVSAGALVNYVAQQVGGKGGGRADLAQGGGDNPAALPAALASIPEWVEARFR
jgi:alanyl-tRNA synthetase